MLKNCERCGIEFRPRKRKFNRARFCSWECRKKPIEKNCLFCKRIFVVSESRNYRKYCSHKCSHDYNALRYRKMFYLMLGIILHNQYITEMLY